MFTDFEILEITDLTIETSEMSVNRNAFMKWADDHDYREYEQIVHMAFGEIDQVTRTWDWKDYICYTNKQFEIDLQEYITMNFSRNQPQLYLCQK